MAFPTKNVNFILYDLLGCVRNFETCRFERDYHPNRIFDPVSSLSWICWSSFDWFTLCNLIHHPCKISIWIFKVTDFLAHQLPHSQPPAWVCWSCFNLFISLSLTQRRSAQLFLLFFRWISRFRGQKNTSNMLQSSFLGFVGFLWAKIGGFFFGPTDPEGTWWVHDLPDLVIPGAVCSTPRRFPQRFSGAECVTAFGARCVFSVGCWLLGMMVSERSWLSFGMNLFSFSVSGSLSVGKKMIT